MERPNLLCHTQLQVFWPLGHSPLLFLTFVKGEIWGLWGPVEAQIQGICSFIKLPSPSPSQKQHCKPGPFLNPCPWELGEGLL